MEFPKWEPKPSTPEQIAATKKSLAKFKERKVSKFAIAMFVIFIGIAVAAWQGWI